MTSSLCAELKQARLVLLRSEIDSVMLGTERLLCEYRIEYYPGTERREGECHAANFHGYFIHIVLH